MKKDFSTKKLLEEIINETVSMVFSEEFIGNVGGVNLYQMGGSIKRPELYNLDSKGKPTRDPGVAGLKKSSKKKAKKKHSKIVGESRAAVLSLLKEILTQEINYTSLNEDTEKQTPVSKRGEMRGFGGPVSKQENYTTAEVVNKLEELVKDEKGVEAAFDDPSSQYRPILQGIVNYTVNVDFKELLKLYTQTFVSKRNLMDLFSKIISNFASVSQLEKMGTALATAENRVNLDDLMGKQAADFRRFISKIVPQSKSKKTQFGMMPAFTQKVNSLIPQIKSLLDDALKGTDKNLASVAASLLNTTKQAEEQDLGKEDLVSLVLDRLSSLIPASSSVRSKSDQSELEKAIVDKAREALTKEGRIRYQLFGLDESFKRAVACAFLVCVLSN
jgi:hypothetical protein